jgi:hypothetical protein
MVVTAVFLLIAVVAFGLLFFRLHSLPERMAHRGHKLQLEIVAVLCLISLFTHIHAFWIAALLLALVQLPDLSGWMNRIAGGVDRIAAKSPEEPPEASAEPPSGEDYAEPKPGDRSSEVPPREAPVRRAKDKELTHA